MYKEEESLWEERRSNDADDEREYDRERKLTDRMNAKAGKPRMQAFPGSSSSSSSDDMYSEKSSPFVSKPRSHSSEDDGEAMPFPFKSSSASAGRSSR